MFFKSRKINQATATLHEIAAVNVKLIAAYDRLNDPLRDTDFRAYCAKYGMNHAAELAAARARIANRY